MSRRDGERWFHLDPRHHVNQFTPHAMSRLLERGGLTVVALDTVSALGFLRPARLLHPRGLAAVAKEGLATRTPAWRPHPDRHEILRVSAKRARA